MFRTALHNVLGHKLRLLTTGLAVAIGVAFMAGTLVLTDTIGQTMDEMFASAYAKTDALVRSESTVEVQGFEMRARLDEAILSDLSQLPGVAEAQGDVWGFAQVVGKDGEPVGVAGMGPPTIGANWADGALNTWTMEDGRGPHAADEVVLDKGVADEAGYVVGDTATVLVVGAPLQVTVTGIATFAGSDSPGGASFVMFTTASAQEHVGEPGKFDSVSLSAMPGVSEDELVEQVEAILPSGLEALTGAAFTEENQDAMAQALSFMDTFLLIFAFVALFVGGFIIFNTFFITVAQRTRQHALLRAVGASKRQVLASILVEALFVGIVASAVGLAGGIGIAAALKALLAGFGFDLPAGGIVFTTSTAVVSLAAGVIVTLVAAVAPARKAGKVPPIAAMRDVQAPSSAYGSKLRIGVGVVVLAVGVTALLYGLWGSPANAMRFVGGGAVLVLFADTILARTISRPLSQVIGFPIRYLRGMTGHLARENAMRNPKRTAATASALMIGVALVSFITILASSTKTSFGKVVDRSFLGDVIVAAPGQMMGGGGLSPELAAALRELPEVETAAGIRFGMAEVDGSAEQLLAADDATFDVFDVDPVAGSPDDLDATSIAVFEDVAEDKGLSVGDEVPVEFAHTGVQTMEVALIYGENEPAGDWLLGTAAHQANYPPANHVDVQVFVKRAEGASPGDVLAAVEREAEAYPGAKVLDQSEYKEEQLALVDQMLGLIYALLALAVFIALLGIGNTLALSVLERTHELGLLRAVGMTRRQLRSTIRWEAVIIALQGTALGVIVGVFFGWAMVSALADEGLNTLDVPIPRLIVVMVIAAVAGVVAAILPARRAARMDVLKAVIAE